MARFDFSWGNTEYHQETLENLKAAVKTTKKLCAVSLSLSLSLRLIYMHSLTVLSLASEWC